MQENTQEKSLVKQNILQYIRLRGVSEYKFYKDSGITRGILKQKNGISEDNIARFLAYAPEVNAEWLLTGNGEMLKEEKSHLPSNIPVVESEKQYHDNDDMDKKMELKPRIPFDAAAGTLPIVADSIFFDQCEKLPVIPLFPRYDFTMPIHGDSMEPEFLSGDEVACQLVHEKAFIQWGRIYILDTRDGPVLKRVYDKNDSVLCCSINTKYEDFLVPKEDILHMALVVGVIRRY